MINNKDINRVNIHGHSVRRMDVSRLNDIPKKTIKSSFNTTTTTIVKKNKEINDEEINSLDNVDYLKEYKNKFIDLCKDNNNLTKLINNSASMEELFYVFVNYILPII